MYKIQTTDEKTRIEIGRDIVGAAKDLSLGFESTGLAAIFSHKYLNHIGFESVAREDRIVLIAALLFLVAKVTEYSRSIRDCLSIVMLRRSGKIFDHQDADQYAELKQLVIEKEHSILRILAFNTSYELPVPFLYEYARMQKFDDDTVEVALDFVNDCFLRNESADTDAKAIACTCLLMAQCMAGDETVIDTLRSSVESLKCSHWWERQGVTSGEILSIMDWITDLKIDIVDDESSA